jgi:hypothetical protein
METWTADEIDACLIAKPGRRTAAKLLTRVEAWRYRYRVEPPSAPLEASPKAVSDDAEHQKDGY